MLFKVRTEGKKGFSLTLSVSQAPEHVCPRGLSSSRAPGQGRSRCLSNKKAPRCLCPAVRSGIRGHGMGGKHARCHILLMSWVPLQLPTDFAYVFLELRGIGVSILSHLCESLWFFGSRSRCIVKLQVDVRGVSMTCSTRVPFMQAMMRPPLPRCLHSQIFPFVPV